MPERHRHHDSTERRKLFTITLESCPRHIAAHRDHGFHRIMNADSTGSTQNPSGCDTEVGAADRLPYQFRG
jgi:hypothetical protein